MSAMIIENQPRLEVRLPHTANVKETLFGLISLHQFDLMPLRDSDGNLTPIPRAQTTTQEIGRISIGAKEIMLEEVTYGDTINLPNPRDGIFQVVSPLTIAAANREGRSTDDLLFPFGLTYENGYIKCARGLARAVFQPGQKCIDQIDYNAMLHDIKTVENCGLGTVQLFPSCDDRRKELHDHDGLPITMLPSKESRKKMQIVYGSNGLNRELTEYLGGIPIFDPTIKGVANVPAHMFDARLRLVSDPRIATTLGPDAFKYGIVLSDMSARNEAGGVVGGHRLQVVSQANLEGPIF